MHTTATYEYTATAIDPIHHGAGTAGNTQLLRTQEIVLPDGTQTVVPYISGNSLRNRLRVAAARHALAAMRITPRSLPKAVVDLLFSGGALTKVGANADLELARDVADKFPALTLFGYSAGSSMVAGKLRVDNVHLICQENAWRMPDHISTSGQALLRAGAYRGEGFGTRHDVSRTPDGRQWSSLLDWADSTQMIYEMQVIKPGARFWGALHLEGATDMEVQALAVAVRHATTVTEQGRTIVLGAKGGVGFGRTRWDIPQSILDVRSHDYQALLEQSAEDGVGLWTRLVA